MPPVNDFVPFCPTTTGTNLLTQSQYLASPYLPIGNQPGLASSQLNNKVLRQASFIASQVAQLAANISGTDVNDDANAPKFLGQLSAAIMPLPPSFTSLLSGSGFYDPDMYFFVASANATAGATYTNNSQTFTVASTITAGSLLHCNMTGAPTLSGTLTKSSGTGDSTISFYAVRLPIALEVQGAGGGGGGGGSGTTGSGGTGTDGNSTTFGTSLLVANGGQGGDGGATTLAGTPGGTASLGAANGLALTGGEGSLGSQIVGGTAISGGSGGGSPLGGAGGGGGFNSVGGSAAANTGGGGGGGGQDANSNGTSGSGGGSGGYFWSLLTDIVSNFAYSIGTGGTGGTAGTGPNASSGGPGGSGIITVKALFQ